MKKLTMEKVIRMENKELKKKPNLKNYKHEYHDFNWKEFSKKEIEFLEGKYLNAAYMAVSRQGRGENKNKVALYHLGENLEERIFTFAKLEELSNRFGNLLKSLGVERGERVFFFLGRVPELYWGFLGVLKIGAIAGTLFSAFGEQALFDRLDNSDAKILITSQDLVGRVKAIKGRLGNLKKIILIEDLEKQMAKQSDRLKPALTSIEDPAFMLYTSGTTGKPKGVVHRHGAVIQQLATAKYVLDLQADDVYWCTADPGWVTGIVYEILGNWSAGVSTLVYQGRFDPAKWYEIIEKYKVTVWYSAPTAIRLLKAAGDKLVRFYNLSSLRHLCSVGEPLNPEPLLWSNKVFGLPFHDTWWQTETGAIMVANYPAMDIKVGSMGKPIPGVEVAILDEKGQQVPPLTEGDLAVKAGWPSMMEKIWRRPKKYASYFKRDWYISGDRAYMDNDGYFWFVGRADDVIKTAGERVGPFEVESALVSYPGVIEAGVIGKPDAIRGQIIKAFVALKEGVKGSEALKNKIQVYVKRHLAGHAYPREIEFVDSLPKTRSGKIVRRLLRARELGLPEGDTSTLVGD